MVRRTLLAICLSCAISTLAVASCSSGGGSSTSGGGGAGTGAAASKKHGLTKQQAGEVLVKIGDTTITVGDFADRLADQSPYLRARYNSPERRREFLDNLVRFELLAREAERRGLNKLDDVERTRKQMMIQEMMKREYEDRVRIEDITDAEISAYYEANRAEFHKPEQVRASDIMIRDRAKAQRILTQILARADDVTFFRQMAEQNNEDPETRDRFGDLRFFSRPAERQPDEPTIAPPVADAAFSITQIGGVHRQLVQTPEGFHIIKLTGRRAALDRTLDEARRPIQNKLWRERRERSIDDLVARLRRESHVETNLALLDQLHVDMPAGGSPTVEGAPGAPGVLGMPPGPNDVMGPDGPHGALAPTGSALRVPPAAPRAPRTPRTPDNAPPP